MRREGGKIEKHPWGTQKHRREAEAGTRVKGENQKQGKRRTTSLGQGRHRVSAQMPSAKTTKQNKHTLIYFHSCIYIVAGWVEILTKRSP